MQISNLTSAGAPETSAAGMPRTEAKTVRPAAEERPHATAQGKALYFLHIAKTAGTSLISQLQKQFTDAECLYEASTWPEVWALPPEKFASARFYRGHFGINLLKLIGKPCDTITFLRDPLERVVSHYHHELTTSDTNISRIVREESLSLRAFVEHPFASCVARNFQTCSIGLDIPVEKIHQRGTLFRAILDYDIDAVTLRAAKQNMSSFIMVGVKEWFDLSLLLLFRKFGWLPDLCADRYREADKSRVYAELSAATRKLIERKTELDAELYAAGKEMFVRDLNAAFDMNVDVSMLESANEVQLREITEEAHRQTIAHYRMQPRTPRSVVHWSAEDRLDGLGWHDVHARTERPHRWSGPGRRATIDLALLPGRAYRLRAEVLRFVTREAEQGLAIHAGTTRLQHDTSRERGRYVIEAAVPAEAVGTDGLTTITFEVPETRSFAELRLDPSDPMKRGLALEGLALEPAEAGSAGPRPVVPVAARDTLPRTLVIMLHGLLSRFPLIGLSRLRRLARPPALRQLVRKSAPAWAVTAGRRAQQFVASRPGPGGSADPRPVRPPLPKRAWKLPKRVSSPFFADLQRRWPAVPTLAQPQSQLCTASQFNEPEYKRMCEALRVRPTLHRKQWEFVYILRCLHASGSVRAGARGLVFGVGRERIPSYLALQGCQLLVTDLPPDEDQGNWAGRTQHAQSADQCFFDSIVDRDVFRDRVLFRPVNMMRIPSDLTDFDFCWSACCFEHLGSLDAGFDFVRHSLDCLVPGGIAVHTTEFNIGSPDVTLEDGSCVVYRERDIAQFVEELQSEGHRVSLNLCPGNDVVDTYVDAHRDSDIHLRLYVAHKILATSIGLYIQKAY